MYGAVEDLLPSSHSCVFIVGLNKKLIIAVEHPRRQGEEFDD
jgi:hypothetical protein